MTNMQTSCDLKKKNNIKTPNFQPSLILSQFKFLKVKIKQKRFCKSYKPQLKKKTSVPFNFVITIDFNDFTLQARRENILLTARSLLSCCCYFPDTVLTSH